MNAAVCVCIILHTMGPAIETNSHRLIALLKADGWVHVATKGDHMQFKHPTRPGRVTLPHPVKDLKVGTALSVYRQAGWR